MNNSHHIMNNLKEIGFVVRRKNTGDFLIHWWSDYLRMERISYRNINEATIHKTKQEAQYWLKTAHEMFLTDQKHETGKEPNIPLDEWGEILMVEIIPPTEQQIIIIEEQK